MALVVGIAGQGEGVQLDLVARRFILAKSWSGLRLRAAPPPPRRCPSRRRAAGDGDELRQQVRAGEAWVAQPAQGGAGRGTLGRGQVTALDQGKQPASATVPTR